MSSSEFCRFFNFDKVGTTGAQVRLTATPEECQALAVRFSISEVRFLEVLFQITRDTDRAQTYLIEGTLKAEVVQPCVVTLLDIHTPITAALVVKAVPTHELTISSIATFDWAEEIDEEVYTQNQLDLGEIAAQYLALEIPFYPRHPHAPDTDDTTSPDDAPDATSPGNVFNVLKDLKSPPKK